MSAQIPEPQPAHASPRLQIDLWLDVACPWCVVGERRLHRVIDALPFGRDVDIRFRSYQLQPDAPERATMLQPEYLASRGMDMTRFRSAQQQLVTMGAELGFAFNQDIAIPSNTFTAHRLIHAAAESGAAPELVPALFSVYFSEGRDIGDPEVLREVAVQAGVPAELADRVLANPDLYRQEVLDDIERASEIGASGVPFAVLAGKYGLSGAQPESTIEEALRTVHAELAATHSGN